jgi:hypothetical protein
LRDLYNKAKQKAQNTVNTTSASRTSTDLWFTYCKATTTTGIYYTPVFSYDHSQTGLLFNQVIPAWQQYASEKFGTTNKTADCNSTASGPASRKGDQTMLKLRTDDIEAERRYSEQSGRAAKPVDTDWTYNNQTPVTASASSSTASASGTTQARAMPHHAGQHPVDFWYCSTDMRETTIYFSAPFSSTDGNAATRDFVEYLKQKYGYESSNLPACFGNHPDLNATQTEEQKRITDMKSSTKWKIVETGWTPANSN